MPFLRFLSCKLSKEAEIGYIYLVGILDVPFGGLNLEVLDVLLRGSRFFASIQPLLPVLVIRKKAPQSNESIASRFFFWPDFPSYIVKENQTTAVNRLMVDERRGYHQNTFCDSR